MGSDNLTDDEKVNQPLVHGWDEMVAGAREFVYGGLVSSWFLLAYFAWTLLRPVSPSWTNCWCIRWIDRVMSAGGVAFTLVLYFLGPRGSLASFWTVVAVGSGIGVIGVYKMLYMLYVALRRWFITGAWCVAFGPYKCLYANGRVGVMGGLPEFLQIHVSRQELGSVVSTTMTDTSHEFPGDITKMQLLGFSGSKSYRYQRHGKNDAITVSDGVLYSVERSPFVGSLDGFTQAQKNV